MASSPAKSSWFVYALRSAVPAALTAIFAKAGVAGVNSDMATLIRAVVILVFEFEQVRMRQQR